MKKTLFKNKSGTPRLPQVIIMHLQLQLREKDLKTLRKYFDKCQEHLEVANRSLQYLENKNNHQLEDDANDENNTLIENLKVQIAELESQNNYNKLVIQDLNEEISDLERNQEKVREKVNIYIFKKINLNRRFVIFIGLPLNI